MNNYFYKFKIKFILNLLYIFILFYYINEYKKKYKT